MDSSLLIPEACSEVMYIVPCLRTWDINDPQPAGSLTMKRISVWPENGEFSSKINSHFVCIEATSIPDFPDMKEFLMRHYDSVLAKLQNTQFILDLPVEKSNCISTVTKYIRYAGSIQEANEATLRLVYANAMALMICTLNGYMFKVEDRVVVPDKEDDDYDYLHQGISQQSVADYICYSVRGEKRVVAVILETKTKFTWNSLAQLLGYYYRVATDLKKPGMCVLITRQGIHVILFPFYSSDGNLVNAVCLKEISLEKFEVACELFAILTSRQFSTYEPIFLKQSLLPLRKSFQYQIEVEQDQHLQRLEKMIAKLEREVAAGKREIAELKCKLTVHVPHTSFAHKM